MSTNDDYNSRTVVLITSLSVCGLLLIMWFVGCVYWLLWRRKDAETSYTEIKDLEKTLLESDDDMSIQSISSSSSSPLSGVGSSLDDKGSDGVFENVCLSERNIECVAMFEMNETFIVSKEEMMDTHADVNHSTTVHIDHHDNDQHNRHSDHIYMTNDTVHSASVACSSDDDEKLSVGVDDVEPMVDGAGVVGVVGMGLSVEDIKLCAVYGWESKDNDNNYSNHGDHSDNDYNNNYDSTDHSKQLRVDVHHVGLIVTDTTVCDDAFIYVVISLLPDKTCFKSQLCPLSTSVIFTDASAVFSVTVADLHQKILKVDVFRSDENSEQHFIGDVTYKVVAIEKSSQRDVHIHLSKCIPEEDKLSLINRALSHDPEIKFSLSYMPASGRLVVVALEGRHIHVKVTFLKISLTISGKAMKTVQTSKRVTSSSYAVYNESFVFHTPMLLIRDTDVVVTVMIKEKSDGGDIDVGFEKVLGVVTVGLHAGCRLGRRHWHDMLTSPGQPVNHWHVVR